MDPLKLLKQAEEKSVEFYEKLLADEAKELEEIERKERELKEKKGEK